MAQASFGLKRVARSEEPIVLVPLIVGVIPVQVQVPLAIVLVEIRDVPVAIDLAGGTLALVRGRVRSTIP